MRSPLRYAEGPALLPPSTTSTRTLSSNWVTCMRKSSELLHVNYMEMEAACDVEAMVAGEGGARGQSYGKMQCNLTATLSSGSCYNNCRSGSGSDSDSSNNNQDSSSCSSSSSNSICSVDCVLRPGRFVRPN